MSSSAANIPASPRPLGVHPSLLTYMDTFLRPEAAGLYDPAYEHDNCGVGAVADLSGEPRHQTLIRALAVPDRLEPPGATVPEIDPGDGAGILLQMPDEFLRAVTDFDLPPQGR